MIMYMKTAKPPLIAIVGPNSAGKTSLSIRLAKKFNCEIISADSRQVYKGMDIGTGKATKQEQRMAKHHLLDIASPTREYNVAHFKCDAEKIIRDIHKRDKLPILVGGTAFWIYSIIDDLKLPQVKPNKALRKRLAKKTSQELFAMLKKLDQTRAQTIDQKNPYRLIRAIEIVKATKKPISKLIKHTPYNLLMLGVTHPREKLFKRIDQRLTKRFKQGMIAEVRQLHTRGVSWKRMHDLGLEYRFISLFLQKKLTRDEMNWQLSTAIKHYAKRQMTWFERDKRIHWIQNQREAVQYVKKL